MKKSVVLFISLLFIATLSVLIIENLNDTNKFLSKSHDKFNKVQAISLMENLQKEISKKIIENKENIKEIIDEGLTSNAVLPIKDFNMIFSLTNYDKLNVNDLINTDKNISKNTSDILYSYEIYNVDYLKSLLKENNIESMKQLDFIIEQYAKQNDDEKIYEVKNLLGFLQNQNLYELKVNFNDNTGTKMNSYYVLDDKGEVKYFEYSIN